MFVQTCNVSLHLPNCCVWLLACSHATTTQEPKLHHRCHEPVTTAHGCISSVTGCCSLAQGSLRKTPNYTIVAGFLAPLQDSCRLSSLQLTAIPSHIYDEANRC